MVVREGSEGGRKKEENKALIVRLHSSTLCTHRYSFMAQTFRQSPVAIDNISLDYFLMHDGSYAVKHCTNSIDNEQK
jgi:hypothetical protein